VGYDTWLCFERLGYRRLSLVFSRLLGCCTRDTGNGTSLDLTAVPKLFLGLYEDSVVIELYFITYLNTVKNIPYTEQRFRRI
jgi:hypothetical protein